MKDRGYSWAIVAACFVGLIGSISPILFNTLPIFLKSIAADTGWNRGQILGCLSLSTIGMMLGSPSIGRLVDRYGPRLVIMGGVCLFAACLAALHFTSGSNYLLFLFISFCAGLFGNCTNTFVYMSFMPRWFDARIGLALGIAASGIGVGQALSPIVAKHLLETIGWRNAYYVLAVYSLAITLIVAIFFLRDRQSEFMARSVSSNTALEGMTLHEAMRTSEFWRICISVFLITIAVTGCLLNFVPLSTDRGMTLAAAARIAACGGLSVMVSRIATGLILDYVSPSLIGFVSFAAATIGVASLAFANTVPLSYFAVIALGCALGVEGDLLAYFVKRLFGRRAYGQIYGCFWASYTTGFLIGPILLGFAYDRFGSYRPMLYVYATFGVIASLAVLSVRTVGAHLKLSTSETS